MSMLFKPSDISLAILPFLLEITMRDKDIDLNTSESLRESSASYAGGENSGKPGLSDLKRGFTTTDPSEANTFEQFGIDSLKGFAGRPHGWER